MFGEESILGRNELTVDKKGRIFIPANTKREQGESLVLTYNKDLETYEIYSSNKFSEILDTLNNKILNATTKQEKIYYQKELCEVSKSILKCSKVDALGRFLTGKVFENQEKVLSIGCHDHLIIEKLKNKK